MEGAPIAGAPAMIAMAHRANGDHAIADAQCSGDPADLLDAVVGSIGRATAGMRRIGVGWVECLETEIDRGFGPFPADLGSLEGKILPHREALDLPGIEVHVTRDGAVRKIAGDRLPADARTPDAEGGAGDAILVDPGVGEERDLLLGHDDAIGDGFAHQRSIGESGRAEEHTSELQSLMRISY